MGDDEVAFTHRMPEHLRDTLDDYADDMGMSRKSAMNQLLSGSLAQYGYSINPPSQEEK